MQVRLFVAYRGEQPVALLYMSAYKLRLDL